MSNPGDDKKIIFLDADAGRNADSAKRLSKQTYHCKADTLLLSGEKHSPSVEDLKTAPCAEKETFCKFCKIN